MGPAPTQSPTIRYGHLAELIISNFKSGYERKQIRILEIGAWTGSSSCLISHLLSELIKYNNISKTSELVVIDPWVEYFNKTNNSKHYWYMNKNLSNGNAEKYYKKNLKKFGEPSLCVTIKDYSENVLEKMESGSFDLIYIDGSHSYKNVKYDMEQAMRLVKKNGIICGDDLETLSIVDSEAHCKAIAEDRDYLQGYHPGVTQAFLETFQNISECNVDGFWAVKKSEKFEGLCKKQSIKPFSLIPFWVPLISEIFLSFEDENRRENHIISARGVYAVKQGAGPVTHKNLRFKFRHSRFISSRKEYFIFQIKSAINN